MAELKDTLDTVRTLLVKKKPVQFAAEVGTYELEDGYEEDVNYVGGSGYQGQRFNNQQNRGGFSGYGQRNSYQGKPQFQNNNGFTQNYTPPPQPAQSAPAEQTEMKSMLERLLEGQQKISSDLNGKMESLYTDLNGRLEALSLKFESLDSRVRKTEERSLEKGTNSQGRSCNAIYALDDEETEPQKDSAAEMCSQDVGSAVEVPVSIDTAYSVSIDTNSQPRKIELKRPAEPNVYKPKLPFPRARKSRQELYEAKCMAMMDKLTIEIPHIDTIKIAPMLKRYLMKIFTADMREEECVLMISDVCSAVIQNRIPKKLKDPGSFVLDCSIFKDMFKGSLCDLGSTVSLMPYSVAVRLGMTDFTPTRITLSLADRSVRIPEGLLEDVPVRIGECMIPTDFVVLKYGEEPKNPLILGRPFLATAGALVDVRGSKIALNVGDLVMNFDMDKLRRTATIDGQTFSVETSNDITAGYVEEFGSNEQVKKQASELEDWSSDHIFRTGLQDEGLFTDKLLEEDVFLMETRISELNCRKSADFRATGSVSIDTTTGVGRHPLRVFPESSETAGFRDGFKSASSRAVVKQKDQHPTLHSSREKQRYALSVPKPPDIINKTFQGTKTVLQLTKPRNFRRRLVSRFDDSAGKRSIPPILFAYTPPWMKRKLYARHSLPHPPPPLPDPPVDSHHA